MDMDAFMNRIALERTNRGLTQSQFGHEFADFASANVNYGTINVSSWERGTRAPSLFVFREMCLFFNVSADYLLGATCERDTILRRQTPAFKERLADMMEEKKLEPKDVVAFIRDALTETSGRLPTVNTVNSWLDGKSLPSLNVFCLITDEFKTSYDYMLGLSDTKKKKSQTKKEKTAIAPNASSLRISVDDLPKYDGVPVFLRFTDYSRPDAWAIYNDLKKCMVTKNVVLFVSELKCEIYSYAPPEALKRSFAGYKPLSLSQVMSQERFWIQMSTPNPIVKAEYDGWYHHNENKTAIINAAGLVLPYDGLGVHFNAFSQNI